MRISLRPDAAAALSWPETPAPMTPGPRQSPRHAPQIFPQENKPVVGESLF